MDLAWLAVGPNAKTPCAIPQAGSGEFRRSRHRVYVCAHRLRGPPFTSHAMDLWAYRHGVKIDFSRPGKPTDNAFVESSNGTFRPECLDTHWCMDLKEAKQRIEAWRREYNESRPHRSLDDRTPRNLLKLVPVFG